MRVISASVTVLLCLAFTATLLTPNAASAYCLNKITTGTTDYAAWKKFPIKYKVSSNLTDATILKAIDDAFATWASAPCSKLKFQKDGTFDLATTKFDGHGVEAIYVFWYTAAAGFPTDPKYVAYTFFGHDNAGGLVQASVAANAFGYNWATDGDKAKLDVQGELVTLIGQVLGFATSNSKASVMQNTILFGDTSKRVLGPDDLDAVHQLYNEANCPAAPAPGANGCSGSPPGADGAVANPDGSTPPKTDGSTPPKADGSTPPKTDGSTPPTGDGSVKFDSFAPSGDGGGTSCVNSSQCASDQVCTAEGKCVKIGGGEDGGCCSVAADAPPTGLFALMALLGALWLTTRKRRR